MTSGITFTEYLLAMEKMCSDVFSYLKFHDLLSRLLLFTLLLSLNPLSCPSSFGKRSKNLEKKFVAACGLRAYTVSSLPLHGSGAPPSPGSGAV